jgi:lipoprotein-anchoring transpeptidase ErfK/SrfK
MLAPVKVLLALLVPMALALPSCATKPAPKPPEQQAFQMYHWDGDSLAKTKGTVTIDIYLDQQKAYLSKGGRQIGWTYVATGLPGHETPSGKFQIREKVVDKISNLYGRLVDFEGNTVQGDFNLAKETLPEGCQFKPARMPLYMRLKDDGTGMHVGPIPHPGRRASHGCIRMPRVMAERFFSTVSVGTPVTIHQGGGPSAAPAATETKKGKKPLFGRS